jgi:signal transduction histidine kinase
MLPVSENGAAESSVPSLSRLRRRLTLGQLQWATVVVPLAFLALYYYLMLGPLRSTIHAWYGVVTLWILLPGGFALLSRAVFGAVRSMQAENISLLEETRRTNERLIALHEVNLALSSETAADVILQRVVDLSASLTRARAAGLVVVDEQHRVTSVLVAGATEAERGAYVSFIATTGVIEEFLSHPQRALRIEDLQRLGSPQAAVNLFGATALLGLPLLHQGAAVGGLFLVDKEGGSPFGDTDDQIVRMFASHAALVIHNVRVHESMTAVAIEHERHQISRELHDGLAQVLSFVNTKAQAVEEFLRSGDSDSAQLHLSELSQAARRVYADVREGIVALRTQGGENRDLRAVLDEYLEEFRTFSKLAVEIEWNVEPDEFLLPPVAEVQLLRIVQEALTNARRHAHASSVLVTFASEDGGLAVSIRDDGRGFDPTRPARGDWPRFGLRAMHERAESAGGSLRVDSELGAGTQVSATFPRVLASSANA